MRVQRGKSLSPVGQCIEIEEDLSEARNQVVLTALTGSQSTLSLPQLYVLLHGGEDSVFPETVAYSTTDCDDLLNAIANPKISLRT